MKEKFQVLITLLLLSVSTALGQTITAKGLVVDELGDPVPSATIRLKNDATKGTFTSMDGEFTLQAKQGELIVISFVGYKTQELPAAAQMGTIRLVPDADILDEVVVVGYGKTTKRSFTGSAVTVSGESLEKKAISNVSQALAGEVPGVNVVNTNGQPGSSSDIYVRGVGSVNASSAPLYVVDGVPYSGSISSINPSDIESTTLLKDAASTSIYGARGANGVIVITTKSGKSGKINMSADVRFGMNTSKFIARHQVITDPEEYLEIVYSSLKGEYPFLPAIVTKEGKEVPNDDLKLTPHQYALKSLFSDAGIAPNYNFFKENDMSKVFDENGKIKKGLPRRYTPENWQDEALQPSMRTEANFQISGGSEKIRTFLSLGYLDDKGISRNSRFQRISGRLNSDLNVNEWLRAKANIGYSRSLTNAGAQSNYSSTNLFTFLDYMPPIYPVYKRDAKGNVIISPYYKDQYEYDYGEANEKQKTGARGYSPQSNALATAVFNQDKNVMHNLVYSLNATISFLKHFTFENTFAGTYNNQVQNDTGNYWYGEDKTNGGSVSKQWQSVNEYNFLSLLRYSNTIDRHHNIEAFVAHEAQQVQIKTDGVTKYSLADPFSDDLSNALVQPKPSFGYTDYNAIESYFAQASYDYNNRYFVSATYRRDGSSRFLNRKWGNFGSLGLAWVVTDEAFMRGVKYIDFLKLKASYGTLGQQSGISRYAGLDIYSISNLNGKPAIIFNTKGNPDLTWERSNMLQIGAEISLFKQLMLNIEFYDKTTYDLIYSRRVAPSNGYALYNTNDARIRNYGVDIDLTWNAYKSKDAYLTVRANAGFLQNRMERLPFEPSTGKRKIIDDSVGSYGRIEGGSLYNYYMRNYEGVNPKTGVSQWTMYYYDANKNNAFDTDEEKISSLYKYQVENPGHKIGKTITEKYADATYFHVGKSALPTVRGSFSLLGGYKGLDLSVQFLYGLGGYGIDAVYMSLMGNVKAGAQNWHVDIRDRWSESNKGSNIPRINNANDKNTSSISTRFLTSNSFLNLANVRLGYTLPKSWYTNVANDVNIWISGDNLLLLSARKGYNPATSLTGTSSEYRYNPLSSISAGVKVTF